MKVFKGIIFSLIAIVLILVIAFAVVINLTPRQLGVADLKIEGKTVEEMGIADTKIVDIYKSESQRERRCDQHIRRRTGKR